MSRSEVETILEPRSLSFFEKVGDWLVLFFITKNLDTLTNNELIRYLNCPSRPSFLLIEKCISSTRVRVKSSSHTSVYPPTFCVLPQFRSKKAEIFHIDLCVL